MLNFARIATAFALTLGASSFALPAQATVVAPQSLRQMSEGAEVIIRAEVLTQRVIKERGRIVTETDLKVLESLKGERQREEIVTLGQLGGALNGERMMITGTSEFTIGEEVIVFGMNYGDGRIISYGIGMGKFQVLRDGTGAEVVEEVGDVVAPSRTANGRTQMTPVHARAFLSLDAFTADVTGYVEAVGGKSLQTPLNRSVSKTPNQSFVRRRADFKPPQHPAYSPRGGQ